MPTTLEPRPTREGQNEAILISERQTLEVPEYDEAGLRELIDQARAGLEADEAVILESANRHMTDAMEIDRQTADSLFNRGGFAARVKNAKDRMSALTRQTQERISSLVNSKPETQTKLQQVKTEPQLETDHGNIHHAMNLDNYMATYPRLGLSAIRDKARFAQLKLKGLENPERVLGFIHYIEDRAAGYEHEALWVKDSELEKEKEKYKRKGYSCYGERHDDKKNRTWLSISKDVAFHLDMRDARQVAGLVKADSDPVELFERLRSLGYKMTGHDFSVYSAGVRSFLNNPGVTPLLKKLQSVEGKIALPKERYLFDGSYEANGFIALAELDAKQNILNETSLKNLSVISEVLGHPINTSSIEAWMPAANDPNSMELLLLARDSGSTFSQYDNSYVLRNLESFKTAGIASDVTALVKQGFDPLGFSLNQLNYHMVPSVSDFAPAVLELKANPDFRKFVLEVAPELGVAPTLNPDDFNKFRICFKRPKEAFELLRIAKQCGLPEEGAKWDIYRLETIFRNQGAVEAITQPGFSDFLSSIKKAGYKPEVAQLFPPPGYVSYLYEAFADQDFREKITEEQNILLAKQINFFRDPEWKYKIRFLDDLSKIPGALRSLKILEQKFGYECDTQTTARIENLIDMLRDPENMDNLTKPSVENAFNLLKQMGYTFSESDARPLIELSWDDTFLNKILDPETLKFIARSSGHINLRSIRALAGVDITLRPAIETLAKEFSHLIYVGASGQIDDIDKLTQLRDNPKIFETARRLRELNIRLNPVTALEKIKQIGDKNLFEVLAQCREFPQARDFILKNVSRISSTAEGALPVILTELLNNEEGQSVRESQMIRGELMGFILNAERYDILEQMAAGQAENLKESRRIVEKLKNFIEHNNVSGKGATVAILLTMREYREDEGFTELLDRIEKSLDSYQRLLEHYSPHNIPTGLRASIGMEYEITVSTSNGYSKLNQEKSLGEDMRNISRFANVGQGADAVFEIATKPSDNPYMMLLEMQLLQDLEFIDFNFRRSGYEKGSRGYHMTIGGEYGIEVGRNSNFLQNTLVMSGWGGINAGKNVDKLSKGRSSNIRQRGVSDTKVVFGNARRAVEFRSLSLDTWEPFERTVETSYYGAIAVQAFEKHVDDTVTKALELGEIKADNPEQFYELLQQRGLLKETTNDSRTRQIIFEWAKLQQGVVSDLSDHNENFLQNEMYGYEDEKGKWVDAGEFGGTANKDRFIAMAGGEPQLASYAGQTRIEAETLFKEATPDLANKFTTITNLFIKSSAESGGDIVNASASLDTTKVGRTIEDSDPRAKYQSFFDTNGKTREGYYYTQGGSERMLLHKTQMRLLEFNRSIRNIIA